MAKADRCPICKVPVKAENLLRHLNDVHPRHPETPTLREKLKAEPGRVALRKAGPPFRIRRVHVAVILAVVLVGAGAYYLPPMINPSATQPFPCVTGRLVYHWHTQLSIFSGGTPVTIPASVGLSSGCAEPLHTHDATGSIHVESDTGRLYSVGDFFTVWRKSFGSPTQILVNGTASSPSPSVILYDQETIALHYASFSA